MKLFKQFLVLISILIVLTQSKIKNPNVFSMSSNLKSGFKKATCKKACLKMKENGHQCTQGSQFPGNSQLCFCWFIEDGQKKQCKNVNRY
jgi:hypothetical protein